MFGCILYMVIKLFKLWEYIHLVCYFCNKLTCLNFGDPSLYVSNGQKKKISLCAHLKQDGRGVKNKDKSSCLGPSARERA